MILKLIDTFWVDPERIEALISAPDQVDDNGVQRAYTYLYLRGRGEPLYVALPLGGVVTLLMDSISRRIEATVPPRAVVPPRPNLYFCGKQENHEAHQWSSPTGRSETVEWHCYGWLDGKSRGYDGRWGVVQ